MSPLARQLLVALGLLTASSAAALAVEPIFEFLHAAQDRGYGEVSVDYLEQLQAKGRMPRALAETIDLELSRSYRVAAAEAFNAAEAEQRMGKAEEHLNKFLKEHPNHAEVPRAMESWGEISLDRALERMRQAAVTRDKDQKAKLLTMARADLDLARQKLSDATSQYQERYNKVKAALPEGAKRPKSVAQMSKKQRQAEDAATEAETAWLEARFKLAKIDFYLGQTYLDPAAPERKAALQKSAQGFDEIFQNYRENQAGLHAHLWQGRAADEMGNDALALDLYDEVLATAPDGRERETGLEPLFAQAQYHRLMVILRGKNGPEQFLEQAPPWLQLHRDWKKFDGYQGVALEVARLRLKAAAELTGAKKSSEQQAALALLSDIVKVRGEHQQAAILLRREYVKAPTQDPSSAKTFDEALALADEAAQNRDWNGALASLTRALELSSAVKDPKRLADVHARIDQARYQIASSHFSDGQFEEALAALKPILDEQPESGLAPAASSLAVSCALSLYAKAADKPAALEVLVAIANDTIKRWPDKPEADDARIALGQASLVRGELPAAIEVFERVDSRSQRYPSAMFLAGQTHWRLYVSAKAQAQQDAAALAANRTKAEEQLRISLAAQRKEAEPGKPLARQTLETQLLLGEILIEKGTAKEADELLNPLVEWILSTKPETLDNVLLRVFLAAGRAKAAQGDGAKVSALANQLAATGPDNPAVNGVLNSLCKSLGDQWKLAEAAVIEAKSSPDPAKQAAAATTANERKQALVQLLTQLAPRKQNTLPAMIYIADLCAQTGQADMARELYQAILAQAEGDAAFKQANGPALTRVQSQLVGLLRQKGEYAEGVRQVDKLIEAFPNALEPKMEKGRLLQAWAETEPAHFPAAVAHWTALRTRLAKAIKKPPEYYEVVYNAALCLFTEGQKANNPQKALQAEQLLQATLVLSPNLDGPELVARYKELLQKARQLQGRPVSAAKN